MIIKGLSNSNYEPWFRAWLVLMPIIGLGSYYLIRNFWRRSLAILNGEAGSIWDAPPVPDTAEPQAFVFYAITAALVFTLFWAGISHLYVQSLKSNRS